MPSFNEPLKNWFGYTRRERRATLVLLFLSAAVIGLRYVRHDNDVTFEKLAAVPGGALSESSITPVNRPAYLRPVVQSDRKSRSYERPKTELNTCDSAELERLPGIGPVLSARIIKYRNLLGGYYSVDQLKEVYGLSAETFSLVSGRVTADSSLVKKINLNKSGFAEIIRLPYFSRYEVNSILKYRQMGGSISSYNDLISNKLLTADKARKVRPYIEFSD